MAIPIVKLISDRVEPWLGIEGTDWTSKGQRLARSSCEQPAEASIEPIDCPTDHSGELAAGIDQRDTDKGD